MMIFCSSQFWSTSWILKLFVTVILVVNFLKQCLASEKWFADERNSTCRSKNIHIWIKYNRHSVRVKSVRSKHVRIFIRALTFKLFYMNREKPFYMKRLQTQSFMLSEIFCSWEKIQLEILNKQFANTKCNS